MKFNNLNLKPDLANALEKIGFVKMTQIQEEIIPKALKKKSLIGKSETGSGKTHSFLVPILQDNIDNLEEVQSVIIVPTRELASQIFTEIKKMIEHYPVKPFVKAFTGGSDRTNEIDSLNKKIPNIIIGTIGKLKDYINDNSLINIFNAKKLVIDEADMVFDSDNLESLDTIISKMNSEIQVLIFSATISKQIIAFSNKYFGKFEVIDLTQNKISKKEIEHIFIPAKNSNKLELLNSLIETINPYLAIVFANTKEQVNEIYKYLLAKKLNVALLTGDLESRARKQLLKKVKRGEYQFLAASDIAARGIDIEGVTHIINFELPKDVDFYIHRTGRTARYTSDGVAISLYDFNDDSYILKLHERRLKCVFKTIKDGYLVDYKKTIGKPIAQKKFENELHTKIPLSKKVKPNYKKKRKELIAKEIKKAKREIISKKYNDLNHTKKDTNIL